MSRWDALKPDVRSTNTFREASSFQQQHRLARHRQHHVVSASLPQATTKNSSCRAANTTSKKRWKNDNQDFQDSEAPSTSKNEILSRKEPAVSQNLKSKYERLVQRCLTLREDGRGFTEEATHSIQQLADFIVRNNDRFQPISDSCDLVKDAVDGVFLPYLDQYLLPRDVIMTTTEAQATLMSLNALERLLETGFFKGPQKHKFPTHISKLLAPLVMEVSDSGQEEQKPNHIRLRLFKVLQNTLTRTFVGGQEAVRRQAASCLCQTLRAARAVEGTHKHAMRSRLDVDPALLHQFFVEQTHASIRQQQQEGNFGSQVNGDPVELSLDLLMSLVDRHPEAAPQLATLLLLPNRTGSINCNNRTLFSSSTISTGTKKRGGGSIYSSTCSLCNTGTVFSSAFLRVLHTEQPNIINNSMCSREQNSHPILAAQIMAKILDNIPSSVWEQWLTPSRQTVSRVVSFADRLQAGIHDLMETCRCNLENNCFSSTILAGTILRRIPFCSVSNNSAEWMKSGISLSAILLERFLDATDGSGRSFSSLPAPPSQLLADALINAIGGSETPQGIFLEMSIPMQRFLDANGLDILDRFLAKVAGERDGSSAQTVLRVIVRTHPQPFLSNTKLWGVFIGHVFGKDVAPSKRQGDPQTLLAFLEGRNYFARSGYPEPSLVSPPGEVADRVLPEVRRWLEPSTVASTKMSALAAYGCLLAADWDTAAERSDQSIHLNAIIAVSQNSNAKLKKLAFKTLGDFSTNYFSCEAAKKHGNVALNKRFALSICQCIENELEQITLSTSMALYALGNLARVLKEIEFEVLDPSVLERFGRLLLRLCSSTNEQQSSSDPKLQTNAIRAMGHLVCLLYSSEATISALESGQNNPLVYLSQVLDILSSSVRKTIALALKELSGGLSWKERSTLKKIGWGACHSLSLILPLIQGRVDICKEGSARLCLDDRCRVSVRQCISALMDCVLNLDCLHDKVGFAAMGALCSVDLSFSRSRLSPSFIHDKQLPLGRILIKCIGYMRMADLEDGFPGNKWVLPAKLMAQVEALLLHLLSCCSVKDAVFILSSLSAAGNNGGEFRFLYEWLLLHQDGQGPANFDAVQRAFDTFALAMQKRPDLLSCVDTQLEQLFSSQAKSAVPIQTLGEEDEMEL